MKVAVLGGGLTGLTLGYLFSERGMEFEILEKEKECGGLMRTLQKDDFTFDYGGSHIIFSKNTEVLDFMLSLLGKNKIKNRRNTKILYKGHYVKYPFENGLADLPKQENYECLYHFVQNLMTKEKGNASKPRNLREWFYYTFGKGIAEKYLIPYNEKIWKYPTQKISLEWVERVPNPPIEDLVKSSLGIETEGYTHQLHFYYPKACGIQALIESLKEKIEDQVTTGFEVKELMKKREKWTVSDGRQEKSYDRIVSTIPVQDLVKATKAPKEVKKAASNLKHNSLISVMLGLDRKKLNDLSWLYIPDKDVLPHRVSFPTNFSRETAPAGKSAVLAEITCEKQSETWKMSDSAVIERVIDDLDRLKIIDRKGICFAEARRTEYAYVISDIDYEKNMKIVRNYTDRTGISLVGRFAEFKYLNMDACIEHAKNFVDKF